MNTRYYDDPREYRDYRNDPYEQDIRNTVTDKGPEESVKDLSPDRDRDPRETNRRSQSPVHLRRPPRPWNISLTFGETARGDSRGRRVYSRSSDRSGSCSSLSPPRYDKKLDKPAFGHAKNEEDR